MKVRISLIFILIVLFLSACNNSDTADNNSKATKKKIIMKIAQNSPIEHPYQAGLEKFKEVVEKETNGDVQVHIFPNAQLGNEEQEIMGIKFGLLDATIVSTGSLASFIPKVELFNLPYLFRDEEHFYEVLDGPIGQWMARIIEKRINCIFLGYCSFGIRNAWNKKRPIRVPDDFRGMKIRVTNSPIMLATFNAFGAQATTMDWNELYSALQQGVLDGAECDMVDLLMERFYEVTKYVSLTNHLIGVAAFMFSKKKFDKLPLYVQTAILKGGREGSIAARKAEDELTIKSLQELKKKGLKFFPVDKSLFRTKARSVYQKYADRVGGMKLIEQIISE